MPLSDQVVMETKTATFNCELNKPNQTVTWYKDDFELTLEDAHYKISNEECQYSIQIFNCSLDDTSGYSINAGDVSSSATLTVKGVYSITFFTSYSKFYTGVFFK